MMHLCAQQDAEILADDGNIAHLFVLGSLLVGRRIAVFLFDYLCVDRYTDFTLLGFVVCETFSRH